MEGILERIGELCGHSPASNEALLGKLEGRLPRPLQRVYARFDGVAMRDGSTRDARTWVAAKLSGRSEDEIAEELAANVDGYGLLPLARLESATAAYALEDDDALVIAHSEGEPWVLFAGGPLEGYVARLHSDGRDRLEHRSLEDYLNALLKAVKARDLSPRAIAPSWSHDSADEARMKAMIETTLDAPGPDDHAACRRLRLALQLLTSPSVDTLVRLVDHPDLSVHNAAIARLRVLQGPEAQRARQWIDDEGEQLRARCEALLVASGSTREVTRQDLRESWPRRHDADFDEWFMKRFAVS